jgi:hypothetical protein
MGVFHPSYLTVMHGHPLSVSDAVVLMLVFTIGLAETALLTGLTVKGFYLLSSISFEQDA